MKRNEITSFLILAALAILAIIFVCLIKTSNYKQEKITITQGATLWELGVQYKLPDDDIRQWIYEVRRLNKIHNLLTDMPVGKEIVILKRSE